MLGSIFVANSCLPRITAELRPEHLSHEGHRAIYEAACEAAQSGDVDFLVVKDILRRQGKLEAAGGVVYIAGLVDPTPDAANVERYVRMVIEAAKLRAIITACSKASRSALDRESSTDIASELQQALTEFGVAESISSRGIFDIVRDVHAEADARVAEGRRLGISTGLPSLDRATAGGLPRQAISIVAAGTSHGKTTFALNVADNAAQLGHRVAFYSLEMSPQAMADRLVARRAGVPLSRIRDWKGLNEFERDRVDASREALRSLNRSFFFASRITSIVDLVADARRRKAEEGLDLIAVDYLQLVQGLDEDNRERTVNQIAWRLFEAAKDLDMAVLALSQVTPAAQARTSGRLSIDDLRDSKAIGHHARVVLMLNRPWQSNKDDSIVARCAAKLQIEKNSEGDTGDISLHFNGDAQEFSEATCTRACRYFGRAA